MEYVYAYIVKAKGGEGHKFWIIQTDIRMGKVGYRCSRAYLKKTTNHLIIILGFVRKESYNENCPLKQNR